MNKMMLAVALTIALPGAAFAQAKPAADNMAGMNMNATDMKNMSCKDMHAMMAKGQSMHMSAADMKKMCPNPKAATKTAPAHKHQHHKH